MQKIANYIVFLYVAFGFSNCSSDKQDSSHLVNNNHYNVIHEMLISDINSSFDQLNARYLGVKQQGGNEERVENHLEKSAKVKTYFNSAIKSIYVQFFKNLGMSEESLAELFILNTSNYKHEITQIVGVDINAELIQQNNETEIDFSTLPFHFCGHQEKGLHALFGALRDSVLLVLSDEPFIHDFHLPTSLTELEKNLPRTKHMKKIIAYVFKELYMDVIPTKYDERFQPENTLYKWVHTTIPYRVEEALLKLNHVLLNLRHVEKAIYDEYVESRISSIDTSIQGLVLLKNFSIDKTQYEVYYNMGSFISDKIRYSFDPDLPKNEWTLIEKDYEESLDLIKGIPLDTVFIEPTVIYFQMYKGGSKGGFWWEVYSDTIGG